MRTPGGGWMRMFPTKSSFVIFNLYIILFVAQALLVKGSQSEGNTYSYSTVTVVLLTELLKLIISAALYLYTNSQQQPVAALWSEVRGNLRLLTLYMIPAALYCLYNNLAFHNLAAFDPTTYYLLLQFRVVVTALVYQLVFRRQLSGRQWLALLVLTAGCVLKQLDVTSAGKLSEFRYDSATVGALLLVLVQTLCSCVAGVYNEHLLKGRGHDVHILIQNVFMYLDSILCNILVLLFYPSADTHLITYTDLLDTIVSRPIVLLIICNSAVVGIVTSFFLMTLDSILKVFASGLDLVLTALLCLLLFGIPIHLVTVVSIGLVLVAVWLYSTNPLPKQQLNNDYTADAMEEGEETLLPGSSQN